MAEVKTISGVRVRVTTHKTAWDTWTSEAELEFSPHDHIVVSELSGAEEGLLKQYGTEEDAQRVAFELAERRIRESLAKRGRSG